MRVNIERRLRSLDHRATAADMLVAGGLVLAGLWMMDRWVASNVLAAAAERAVLAVAREDLELCLAEREALRDLVSRSFARAKVSAASLSRSRHALFESSLAVLQEKRLLEKQWEIMTFWIRLDEAAGKIHLMRGDQISESLAFAGARLRAVGAEKRVLPAAATIISKERFASTERPRFEQVGGQLQWEPPQVGTSVRARALGEFVMFTKEGLVIHGPPLFGRASKETEHEAFPHACLSLPAAAARRLYAASFVGTKILLATEAKP